MFDYNKIFYPQNIYNDINFNLIKCNIKSSYDKWEDFGSILAIYCSDCIISVNSIGKIEFFFSQELDSVNLMKEVNNIELIFKRYIDDFKILH